MKSIPICEKCVYYKPGHYARTGVCIRYKGRGKMVYEYSDTVRLDKSKCGPEGKMFLPENKKHSGDVIRSLFSDDE